MNKNQKNQRGFTHLGIILAIVVIAAAAGIGWFVYQKQKDSNLTSDQKAVREALKDVKCDSSDKDLCKFFKSASVVTFTSMDSTTTDAEGKKTTMLIENQGENKTHFKMTSADYTMETITIDGVTYTKAGDTWWKANSASATEDPASNVSSDIKTEFEEPATDTTEPQISYKKVGTEKCGKLTCFKYEVVDPGAEAGNRQYVWFDNKDYMLRRTQMISAGSTTDATFGYDKVTISVPSPVKELGPDQYILPGASGPTSLSGSGMTEEQIQQLTEQAESLQ